jgi:hypothetical protein
VQLRLQLQNAVRRRVGVRGCGNGIGVHREALCREKCGDADRAKKFEKTGFHNKGVKRESATD